MGIPRRSAVSIAAVCGIAWLLAALCVSCHNQPQQQSSTYTAPIYAAVMRTTPTPATRPMPARAKPRPAATQSNTEFAAAYEHQVLPLLSTYCYGCHNDAKHISDLSLQSFKTADAVTHNLKTWEMVLRYTRGHEMPPPEQKQPSEAEREVISAWVDGQLDRYFAQHPDPGRVTIHRMNRAEYNNTIHDLVGVNFHPANDFPPDDSGYGFDNNGDVLSLPPVLMEKYLTAADQVMDQAIVTDPIATKIQRIPASLAQIGFNAFGDRGDGWVKLVSLEEDDVAVDLPILAAGDYILRVLAYATPDGGVTPYDPNAPGARGMTPEKYKLGVAEGPTKISLMLNSAVIKDFEVGTDEAHPQVYETRLGVPSGKQKFRASVRRIRGGAPELNMKNGRLGREQTGIVYVKYLEIEGPLPAATRRFPAADLTITGDGRNTPDGERIITSAGSVATTIDVQHEGEYILRAQAYADQAGTEPARMEFRVDGKAVSAFDVVAPGNMVPLSSQRIFSMTLLVPVPQVYEARVKLTPGKKNFEAAFVNPFSDPNSDNPNLHDRRLIVQNLEVVDLSQAVPAPPMPAPIDQLFHKYSGAADAAKVEPTAPASLQTARSILSDFAGRAWRRPVRAAELDRLASLYKLATDHGDTFAASIKLAMKAALVSPHFLFRGELQPEPDNPNSVHPIDDYALASRLSYFIWSSTPDDELLNLAAAGKLHAELEPQVRRMLASPKARALVDNFAGQWLQFRSMETLAPDKQLFPNYDTPLRNAMQRETEMFFENVLREDRTVMDFLNGDYTFVNERLAKHYGLENVSGEDFRKVSLIGTPRRGILTQGSVLTLTSNPSRTSPVKRGKWVLENLLGTPPPPPPPDVPALDQPGHKATGTLRQQMEQHRADPNCASCHARMDPIGFGLENFDAIGAWRDTDADASVDPSGMLITGEKFSGPFELSELLTQTRQREFLHCLSEKMLTYAIGRGMDYYDHAAIDQISDGVEANDCRFSTLIMEVVKSVPFQMRRGESPPEAN